MRAKGGECANLADVGQRLITDHLKLFPDSLHFGFSGGAPINGSNMDPAKNEWVAIAKSWATQVPAAAPGLDKYARRDLQQLLAHEIDHLQGRLHVQGIGQRRLIHINVATSHE
jgi:hypothetical protein